MPDPINFTGLPETATYEAKIVRLEDGWLPSGGPVDPATNSGILNWPLSQLANRTNWLKSAVTALQAATGAATAAVAGIVKLSGSTSSTATDTAASSAAVKSANDNAETRALKSTIISAAGLAMGGGDLSAPRTITVPIATQADAVAGLDNALAMTPLRVAQAISGIPAPDGSVVTAKIADRAVTGTKIADNTIVGTNIATAAVARSHMATMVAARIMGRSIGSAGSPSDLTADQVLTILALPAATIVTQGLTPAGAIQVFAMSTPPAGWLKANGALVSRTTYATLFAAIGMNFGAGDGTTTFALPDLRGEFMRGWDDARGIDPGRVFGSAQADEYRSHNHGLSSNVVSAGNSQDVGGGNSAGGWGGTAYSGGIETRPRNIALLACIKF